MSRKQDERASAPSRRAMIAGASAMAAAGGVLGGVQAQAQAPGRRREDPSRPSDLTWMPAWRLRELIAARRISPVEVVDHFLARTERLNPALNAFSHVDYDGARAAARAAEAAVMSGERLGPLHGVPVPFKDHIVVRGMPLLYASRPGDPPPTPDHDDIVVERIRRAGGIIMGKTVLAGPPSIPGSANPYDLNRAAGASSSGSASAVAAGLTPLAIGSDGGGSTRLPAAYCGVVGLHPTVGRVPSFQSSASRSDLGSIQGWLQRGWSATYGPISRDALDATIALSVMAGPDWRILDGYKGPTPDYLTGVDGGVSGMRFAWSEDLGFARRYYDAESDRVAATVAEAARRFTRLGARVDDPGFRTDDSHPIFRTMMGAVDSAVGRPSRNRGDLMPLGEALEARERMARQYLELLGRYDVLLTPTTPIVAPTREGWADWLRRPGFGARYTCLTGPFNTLGFPAVAVPCGFVDGMPVSLQIVGRPDEDAKVLRVARAFERVYAPGRHPTL